MARILAYTSPARGHLFPIVEMLGILRDRGHDVAVRTLASEVPMLRERALRAAPVARAIEAIAHDDHGARSPQAAIKRALATFASRGPHEAADLRAAIAEEQPDLLLVDINCWGAAAVAEASALPWATWCPYPLPLPSRDAPPFGPGLRPARGPLGRVRDRALTPLITGGFARQMMPRVNAIRAGAGMPPAVGIPEVLVAAPVVLCMTAEPFEYPRSDWPAAVRMIGPCAWEPPAEEPAWLAELEGPIVLVTTSSEFQDDGRLVTTAFAALRDEPVTVVATVPAQDATGFSPPPNGRIETFTPHGPILRRAVCAVTHGGMGATQKALAAAVPVCVVPFGRDQLEVARRVEVSGAGSRLAARRLRPDRLRDAVRAAIARREGAAAVAAAFDRAGGPAAGASALEGLLRERSPQVA